eukprot:925789_1
MEPEKTKHSFDDFSYDRSSVRFHWQTQPELIGGSSSRENLSQRSPERSPRTSDRSQRTSERSQTKPERSQTKPDRSQRTSDRSQTKPERSQRTSDRYRRSSGRSQRSPERSEYIQTSPRDEYDRSRNDSRKSEREPRPDGRRRSESYKSPYSRNEVPPRHRRSQRGGRGRSRRSSPDKSAIKPRFPVKSQQRRSEDSSRPKSDKSSRPQAKGKAKQRPVMKWAPVGKTRKSKPLSPDNESKSKKSGPIDAKTSESVHVNTTKSVHIDTDESVHVETTESIHVKTNESLRVKKSSEVHNPGKSWAQRVTVATEVRTDLIPQRAQPVLTVQSTQTTPKLETRVAHTETTANTVVNPEGNAINTEVSSTQQQYKLNSPTELYQQNSAPQWTQDYDSQQQYVETQRQPEVYHSQPNHIEAQQQFIETQHPPEVYQTQPNQAGYFVYTDETRSAVQWVPIHYSDPPQQAGPPQQASQPQQAGQPQQTSLPQQAGPPQQASQHQQVNQHQHAEPHQQAGQQFTQSVPQCNGMVGVPQSNSVQVDVRVQSSHSGVQTNYDQTTIMSYSSADMSQQQKYPQETQQNVRHDQRYQPENYSDQQHPHESTQNFQYQETQDPNLYQYQSDQPPTQPPAYDQQTVDESYQQDGYPNQQFEQYQNQNDYQNQPAEYSDQRYVDEPVSNSNQHGYSDQVEHYQNQPPVNQVSDPSNQSSDHVSQPQNPGNQAVDFGYQSEMSRPEYVQNEPIHYSDQPGEAYAESNQPEVYSNQHQSYSNHAEVYSNQPEVYQNQPGVDSHHSKPGQTEFFPSQPEGFVEPREFYEAEPEGQPEHYQGEPEVYVDRPVDYTDRHVDHVDRPVDHMDRPVDHMDQPGSHLNPSEVRDVNQPESKSEITSESRSSRSESKSESDTPPAAQKDSGKAAARSKESGPASSRGEYIRRKKAMEMVEEEIFGSHTEHESSAKRLAAFDDLPVIASSFSIPVRVPAPPASLQNRNVSLPQSRPVNPLTIQPGAAPVSNGMTPVSNGMTPVSNTMTPVSNVTTPISNVMTPVSHVRTPAQSQIPRNVTPQCTYFSARPPRPIPPRLTAFADIDNVHPDLEWNVARAGLTKPTPVQGSALPVAVGGADMLVYARSGTGRSSACLIALTQRLLETGGGALPIPAICKDMQSFARFAPVGLVVVPTKKDVVQVQGELRKFVFRTGMRVVSLTDGGDIDAQERELKPTADVVVAMPGRLAELVVSGRIVIDKIRFMILEAADVLVDLRCEPWLRPLLRHPPHRRPRQTVLIASNFRSDVQRVAQAWLRPEYTVVTVGLIGASSSLSPQRLQRAPESSKRGALRRTLLDQCSGRVLVFVNGRERSEDLQNYLQTAGISAALLHSGKSESERTRLLAAFFQSDSSSSSSSSVPGAPGKGRHRRGNTGVRRVLLVTDEACGTIDLTDVRFIISFDMPDTIDKYIRRICRARNRRKYSTAITFLNQTHRSLLPALQCLLVEAKESVPGWFAEILAEREELPPEESPPKRVSPRVVPAAKEVSAAKSIATKVVSAHSKASSRAAKWKPKHSSAPVPSKSTSAGTKSADDKLADDKTPEELGTGARAGKKRSKIKKDKLQEFPDENESRIWKMAPLCVWR